MIPKQDLPAFYNVVINADSHSLDSYHVLESFKFQPGIIVSLKRPVENLISHLREKGIELHEETHFIDGISKSINNHQKVKNCVYLSSPDSLKELTDIIKNHTNIKELEIKKGKLNVKLDIKLTKELELEGYARELTRFIQESRKKAGLKKQDKIKLNINSKYDLSKMKKEIMEKVNSLELDFNKKDYKNKSKQKIKDHEFEVSFEII